MNLIDESMKMEMVETSEVVRQPKNMNELKFILIQRRKDELEALLLEHELNGGKGRKPTMLAPFSVAIILTEYVEFIKFERDETSKLAVYLFDKGIYSTNEEIIRDIISWLEPKFNKQKANDVIYYLKRKAIAREKTCKKHLIPVGNGIFNLETKTLEPFSDNYVFTSRVETNYNEEAKTSPVINGWNVDTWIKEISCYDDEIEKLLWQVLSDSLNGNYSRRKIIILKGEGNNGKGTYQKFIEQILGKPNVSHVRLDQVGKQFDVSLLVGKTANIGDELPSNFTIGDSATLNSLVTGDPVKVEMKGVQAYFDTFTIVIIQSTNEMPKISNNTKGTYRRLLIVPFEADFTVETDNWKIKDEYIERQDVKEYALYKAINLDFDKFIVPKKSSGLLEEYKKENDPLIEYHEEIFKNYTSTRLPSAIIYRDYKKFLEGNGYKNQLSHNKFTQRMQLLLEGEWEYHPFKPLESFHPSDIGEDVYFNWDTFDKQKTVRGFEKI